MNPTISSLTISDPHDIATLLDRIEQGEPDLFLNVVRRNELPLRSYLAGQLYDTGEVDDLAQEVFVTAYRDLRSFRRGEDFGPWLRGIARHRLLTHFRGQAPSCHGDRTLSGVPPCAAGDWCARGAGKVER